MMRRSRSHGIRPYGPILRRIDRVAEAVNPILMFVAAILMIIDVSCFVAVRISRLTAVRADRGDVAAVLPSAIGPPPKVGVSMDIR